MGLAKIICIGLGFLTTAACAGSLKSQKPQEPSAFTGAVLARPVALLFVAMDENADMKTTREELTAGVAQQWRQMAGDETAALGHIAFSKWAETALGSADAHPTHLAFDKDFDGEITSFEFSERLAAAFKRYDKNEDGALDRTELVFVLSTRSARRQADQENRPAASRGGGGGRRPRR